MSRVAAGGEAFLPGRTKAASPPHPIARERRYLWKNTIFTPPHTHTSRPSPLPPHAPQYSRISILKYPPCDSIHARCVPQTIGGVTYGIAKQVTIVPVQVLSCGGSGTWLGVINGGQIYVQLRAWENGWR